MEFAKKRVRIIHLGHHHPIEGQFHLMKKRIFYQSRQMEYLSHDKQIDRMKTLHFILDLDTEAIRLNSVFLFYQKNRPSTGVVLSRVSQKLWSL
ncbi:hypothetical protein A8L34_26945 [Bacillus sp. FJAT-27264]|nr:hypothetical protein A8L34_26945 [Bacillus sp. FJAT-27264]